ncbi:MAG: phosphoribosylamine--glycine ligase, partial [Bacteroidota bacterium]
SFGSDALSEAIAFLDRLNSPYVLKADGLAAGKGVLIVEDKATAAEELRAMLTEAKFGAASETVVIEEFLQGIEVSVFALTDGDSYVLLPEAKDYKRIGEGDTGLNTGGMGAVSPVPFADAGFWQKVETRIVQPTVQGLKAEGIPYQGFLFFGLMNVAGDPYVIEYNARMGDPETEVVMPRLKTDLLALFEAVAAGELGRMDVETDPRAAATVMLVSGGYPEGYEKGKAISGLDAVSAEMVFHAGTRQEADQVLTSGGRVIAVTAFGTDHKEALAQAYGGAAHINFERKYLRKDIGFDL